MIDKFIYVHILKTAGTTLKHAIFERYYKGKYLYDQTFKLIHNPNVINPPHPLIIENQKYPKGYKKYNVFFGHFKYDKYEHLNLPMFSFVRHPVNRIISQYYYHKVLYEKMGKHLSLIEFCEQWPNHMTDVLGDPSKYEFVGVVEQFKKSLNMMCDKLGVVRVGSILKRRVDKDDMMGKTSNKIKKQIENINSIDMELHEKILNRIRGK